MIRRITLLTNPDVCNLKCPLCFLNQRGLKYSDISGLVGEMSFEVARTAIDRYAANREADGSRSLREIIPSTMGEPLLYSHFDDLLEYCRSLQLPLNLTTNGTFPNEWGSRQGMELLLKSCSDIKVSSLASEGFDGWKINVEKLVNIRNKLLANGATGSVSTVSIQATLHGKNLAMIPELIAWATHIGINRIKWNAVVFLSMASAELREIFTLRHSLGEIKSLILESSNACGGVVENAGSLFMKESNGVFSRDAETCPFKDEVWIMPDGSEEYCPNPERRFGKRKTECCFIK